ncbi:hypothetical protein HK099_002247 [Clydaea vesicula]|uniref:Protection of telomeres protein 1 ssDNA-binding domain-containing protein n=1 Tax=Clydaea vesicula TaxID=447962 RepID=A0AAD5U343_9FUNG|nr:hypothetical protein HK099_002247 [Clydaea vesicula]
MTTDENSIALEYYNLCKAQNNFNCLFDLQSVKTKFDVQILAVAIEKKRPQKTKGTDYSASYLILDPTIADPLTLNVFKPNLKAFPTLNAKGNLISCKINIKEFGGKAQFTTSKPSQLAVLEKNSSLSITDKALSPLVDFLLKWIDSNFLQSDTPIEGRLSQKLSRRLISLHEINYTDNGCFVDMNCLVMRIGTFDGKKAEILVTNFTENENVMFNSSSDEKMSIAVELRKLNQIVFQKSDAFALKNCKNLFFLINLWGTEGEKYQNFLTEKKYYNFRNINLRVEENESCEGHLFPDQKYPNKHFVIEIYKGDEEYEDLERYD